MEWVTLTADDLEGVMTAEEKLLAQIDAGDASPDRVIPVMANLVAEIRSMISTWSPNTISEDTTKIPPGFVGRALAIAKWRVLTSIPDYQPDDARKLEYESAEKFFLLVAQGKIRPEPAADAVVTAVPTEKPSGVEIISSPGSRTGRTRMDGI